MHGVGTSRRLHAPAKDLPHHLRCGRVDHSRRRGGGCLPHVRVALGRMPPVDAALARRNQLPPAGAFMDQGARVRRTDALPLEAHLCGGACPQTLMHEDDPTPTPGPLFAQDHLIRITAGEPVRGRDQHDRKGACSGELASPLQGWSIQACPTDAVIPAHVPREHRLVVGLRGLLEQVSRARDGFLPLVLVSRHARLQSAPFQEPSARLLARVSGCDPGRGALRCCWCRWACHKTWMACHRRALPSRHGTLTQRLSSARGGPSDAIGLPPVRVLVIRHARGLSRAERRPLCTRTGGRWAGATRAPEGEDDVKGQACLVCKRNNLRLQPQCGLGCHKRLEPEHGRVIRFTPRWSCSTMLFRYLIWRILIDVLCSSL